MKGRITAENLHAGYGSQDIIRSISCSTWAASTLSWGWIRRRLEDVLAVVHLFYFETLTLKVIV